MVDSKILQDAKKKVVKDPIIDITNLESELKRILRGEVRFDEGSRALYATDGSNYRQPPMGVVVPRTEEDIVNTIRICNKFNAPLLSRGGGTSLAGQCCNVAVVMDMSKYYNKVLSFNKQKREVTVEPGIYLDNINNQTKKWGLTFGPDPATHSHCTIGGMTGNNSCGIHSLLAANHGYGLRTSDNIKSLEIITYDGVRMNVGPTSEEQLDRQIEQGGRVGQIYSDLKNLRDKYARLIRNRYPKIPRRVSGYNLDELLPENGFNVARALAGSEGTLVTILNETLHLVPDPGFRSMLILGYPDAPTAGRHVIEVLKHKPIGLEGMDHLLVDYMVNRHMHVQDLKLLPEGKAWLIAEFEGNSKEDADNRVKEVMQALKEKSNPPSMDLFDEPEQQEKIWTIRESGLGATAFVPGLPDSWPGWEDSAVPVDRVGDYLKDLRALFNKYGYEASLYGHFGQGCIHCRINFDLITLGGLETYRKFVDEASDLVVSYGGSFSGEHGDGQARAELLQKIYGRELMQAFREFKTIWDPKGKMNPGKVVDPYPILSNLRLGIDYNPWQPKTHFAYPADQGSFARAALRCVGVGKCRRDEGGTMCPSYMVTKEEKHTTRGRAHSLFEMLNGGVIKDRWKSEEVKESLDLCLACKGCKGECPVKVDMATYKAEFLSHYYEGKIRPMQAYAFGLISRWSRLGTKIPGIANFFLNAPVINKVVKSVIGVAQERKIPNYSKQNFKDWFNNREKQKSSKPKVILWVDTFNNYFHTKVAKASVEVLEAAGFQVVIPQQHLCCGRPLYDYGMLDTAKKWLREILDTLKTAIEEEIPIVGLEPSCVSTFRDELISLFPNDEDAKRLSKKVFLLSEFLETYAKDFEIPQLKRKALLHFHCHHKSVLKTDAEISILKKMGLVFQVLDSGCCGMAGAFGFEKEHYEISIKAGERVLLSAVRNADKDTLIITNGFSCKEQISQTTDRKALHLAEIIQLALRQELTLEEREQLVKSNPLFKDIS